MRVQPGMPLQSSRVLGVASIQSPLQNSNHESQSLGKVSACLSAGQPPQCIGVVAIGLRLNGCSCVVERAGWR